MRWGANRDQDAGPPRQCRRPDHGDTEQHITDLQVIGDAGSIALRGRNFVQFDIEIESTVLPAYREPTIIRPGMQRDHITTMLMPELAEFAAAIEGRRAPAITPSDGRRVLRSLDAVVASGRSHRVVAVGTSILTAY